MNPLTFNSLTNPYIFRYLLFCLDLNKIHKQKNKKSKNNHIHKATYSKQKASFKYTKNVNSILNNLPNFNKPMIHL